MNTSLIMYDVDVFLNKYTRFMTKDVYISKDMYDKFLESYNYLYSNLEKNSILYRENSKYRKMFEIREKKEKLLRLHNQKYLKKNLGVYSQFFDNLKIDNELDINQKSVILSNEERMTFINNKNVDSFIVGKVKYLSDILGINKKKILVLVENILNLSKLFGNNDLEEVDLISIMEYKNKVLDGRILISDNDKYNILLDYIMNILFKDKNNFEKMYKAFYNNIYLNKDYRDYDTFSDYHSYMYKRKFLASKFSLDRFVDKEIEKRKNYLRTIKNEFVHIVEEVELSNYLCFNGVVYNYIKDEQIFLISENDKKFKIKVIEKDKKSHDFVYDEGIIYISAGSISDNSYIEGLEEIFKLKNISREKLEKREVYNILKNSMVDSYFSEFISKYLIKYLDYYDMNGSFDGTKLNDAQRDVLKGIYNYYKNYLVDNNFVTKGDILFLLEKDINKCNYKYIIINSDISLELKGSILKIVDEYKDVRLIRENIKLLYDYKKYLHDNKMLPLNDTYRDEDEISALTGAFLKKNLSIINECFEKSEKQLLVYLYDDSNRLLVNKNISNKCYSIIRNSNEDLLIGVNSINDINALIYKDFFTKIGRKMLSVNDKTIIDCEEILKLRKSYSKIILPFLIVDSYHENLIFNDSSYLIKLMIYVSLSKCREELILLCPIKKKKEIMNILKKLKNVSVFE